MKSTRFPTKRGFGAVFNKILVQTRIEFKALKIENKNPILNPSTISYAQKLDISQFTEQV